MGDKHGKLAVTNSSSFGLEELICADTAILLENKLLDKAKTDFKNNNYKETLFNEIEIQLNLIADLEMRYRSAIELLTGDVDDIASLTNEFLYHTSCSMRHLFDVCLGMDSVNGFRLRLGVLARDQLSWAEVNCAWAAAALLVCTARSQSGLCDYVDIDMEGKNRILELSADISSRYSQRISLWVLPMHSHVRLLLRQYDANGVRATDSPTVVLRFEGGLLASENDAVSESADYISSFLLFASYVAVTFRQLRPLEASTCYAMKNFFENYVSHGLVLSYGEDEDNTEAEDYYDCGSPESHWFTNRVSRVKLNVLVKDIVHILHDLIQ